MKRKTPLQFCVFGLVLFYAATMCSTAFCEVDLKKVESAFSVLQQAVRDRDPVLLQRIMTEPPVIDNKARLTAHVLDVAKQESQIQASGVEFAGYMSLIAEGQIIRVEDIDTTKAEKPWQNTAVKMLRIMTRDRRVRGATNFVRQGDEWRWYPMFGGEDGAWPAYRYDLSTPKSAYLTLSGAGAAGGSRRAEDRVAVYEVIASSLQKSIRIEEYGNVIKLRKGNAKWKHPDFSCDQNRLEEEMLPLEDGKQKCKVWRLDEKGKRTTFELFVKEGSEWKWIPDPKCIWYPAKPEGDSKE